MKNISKANIQLILGTILTIFGIVLLITSFILPPLAIIDSSVLAATGEVFTFAGCLLGVDYTYKLKMYKLTHNKEDENDQI